MKVCIICGHYFGFPAIDYLMKYGFVSGIATTDRYPAVSKRLGDKALAGGVSFQILKKESLSKRIGNWLKQLKPDVVFVFSFPFRIPESLLSIPSFGFINFHPSILPSYRGSDPIFWQIKNGESNTGVTAHKMVKKMDAGPIIRMEKEVIGERDTYGMISEKLSLLAAQCAGNVINLLQDDSRKILFFDQDEEEATCCKRPSEGDRQIIWPEMTSGEILSLIKACNPNYEGAVTSFRSFPVRILGAELDSENVSRIEPGTVVENENKLCIAATGGIINVTIVYLQEGIFTGVQFKELFKVMDGEKFV